LGDSGDWDATGAEDASGTGVKELQTAEIGIIGGSGLYAMPELTGVREHRVETPFGDPSDALVVGELEGRKVAFLARHGRGHKVAAERIEFSREYLRDEGAGRGADPVGVGGRFAEGRAQANGLRDSGPVQSTGRLRG